MKNTVYRYFSFAFVLMAALMFFSCGNNNNNNEFSMPMWEIENGDTVQVSYSLPANELRELVNEGYDLVDAKDSDFFFPYYNKDEKIPTIELLRFVLLCGVDNIEKDHLQDQVKEIKKPKPAYVYTYDDEVNGFLDVYCMQKENPQVAFGTRLPKEAVIKICEDVKNSSDFDAYYDDDLELLVLVVSNCIKAQSCEAYFAARSFESKTGITTRGVFLFQNEKLN